jgi:hypothetical protein
MPGLALNSPVIENPSVCAKMTTYAGFYDISPSLVELSSFTTFLFEKSFPEKHDDLDFWRYNLWASEYCARNHFSSSFTVDRTIELMEQKRKDYGFKPFRISGTLGIMARTADKVCRLENLSMNAEGPIFESQVDTVQDWFNYSLVALSLID